MASRPVLLNTNEETMNDFMTKEIELMGEDMHSQDSNFISEAIYDALREKGIDVSSFAWSVSVEYMWR